MTAHESAALVRQIAEVKQLIGSSIGDLKDAIGKQHLATSNRLTAIETLLPQFLTKDQLSDHLEKCRSSHSSGKLIQNETLAKILQALGIIAAAAAAFYTGGRVL